MYVCIYLYNLYNTCPRAFKGKPCKPEAPAKPETCEGYSVFCRLLWLIGAGGGRLRPTSSRPGQESRGKKKDVKDIYIYIYDIYTYIYIYSAHLACWLRPQSAKGVLASVAAPGRAGSGLRLFFWLGGHGHRQRRACWLRSPLWVVMAPASGSIYISGFVATATVIEGRAGFCRRSGSRWLWPPACDWLDGCGLSLRKA